MILAMSYLWDLHKIDKNALSGWFILPSISNPSQVGFAFISFIFERFVWLV